MGPKKPRLRTDVEAKGVPSSWYSYVPLQIIGRVTGSSQYSGIGFHVQIQMRQTDTETDSADRQADKYM